MIPNESDHIVLWRCTIFTDSGSISRGGRRRMAPWANSCLALAPSHTIHSPPPSLSHCSRDVGRIFPQQWQLIKKPLFREASLPADAKGRSIKTIIVAQIFFVGKREQDHTEMIWQLSESYSCRVTRTDLQLRERPTLKSNKWLDCPDLTHSWSPNSTVCQDWGSKKDKAGHFAKCHLVWFWPLISWPEAPLPAKMPPVFGQIQPQVIKCFELWTAWRRKNPSQYEASNTRVDVQSVLVLCDVYCPKFQGQASATFDTIQICFDCRLF